MGLAELAQVEPKSRHEWRAWLRANHAKCTAVWIVYAKKGSGLATLSYADAVEEALCFGWIDGRNQSLDATRYRQLFTPRRAKSGWSKVNKERIARLEASRQLAAAGRARIAAAKADGSWAKLDAVEAREMPPDFARALKGLRGASARFAAFSPSARKAILGWIAAAKRPVTRAARIAKAAGMAARDLRARFDPD